MKIKPMIAKIILISFIFTNILPHITYGSISENISKEYISTPSDAIVDRNSGEILDGYISTQSDASSDDMISSYIYPGIFIESGSSDIFHEQSTFIPIPVALSNGSFEKPQLDSSEIWRSAADGTVLDWHAVTKKCDGHNITKMEIQKAGASTNFADIAADGNQYIEVNTEEEDFVFHDFDTTPYSRIYYHLAHRAIGAVTDTDTSHYDVMRYSLTDATRNYHSTIIDPMEDTDLSSEAKDYPTAWGYYDGIYNVPADQTKTRLGLLSISSYKNTETKKNSGNLVDDVRLATGAYLKVDKISSADISSSAIGAANISDIITYTITITNYGELSATSISLTDTIGDGISYIGNATIDGISTEAAYDDSKRILTIDIGDIAGTLSTDDTVGDMHTITYQVSVDDISGGGSSQVLIESQADVDYQDDTTDFGNITSDIYRSYSNIHRILVTKPLEHGDVSVSMIWDYTNGKDYNPPTEILVNLYRDDILYDENVSLNSSNNWSYTWNDVEIEATMSDAPIATSYDATTRNYNWSILQVSSLSSQYMTSIGTIGTTGRQFEILETYDSTGRKKLGNIILKKTCTSAGINKDGTIDYKVTVTNTGTESVDGIFIIDFLPEYTELVSSDASSELYKYGDSDTLTWFIPTLEGGESKSMDLKVRLSSSRPEGSKIANIAGYRVTDSKIKPTRIDDLIEDMQNDSYDAGATFTVIINENTGTWLQQYGGNINDVKDNQSQPIFDSQGRLISEESRLPATGENNEDYMTILIILSAALVIAMIIYKKISYCDIIHHH